jgi:hypothetical protein
MSGELLMQIGAFGPSQLEEAKALRLREGGSLHECLVRVGALHEDVFVESLAAQLRIPRVGSAQLENIPASVLALVPAEMAVELRALPIAVDPDGTLTLAMSDPTDEEAYSEIGFFSGRFVVRVAATPSEIRRAIERHFGIRLVGSCESAVQPEASLRQPLTGGSL